MNIKGSPLPVAVIWYPIMQNYRWNPSLRTYGHHGTQDTSLPHVLRGNYYYFFADFKVDQQQKFLLKILDHHMVHMGLFAIVQKIFLQYSATK